MGTARERSSSPVLVVGLGNPGPEYEWTPHNLGFLVVDRLADRYGIPVRHREAMALVGTGRVGEQAVVLAKPQTYVNLSGPAVRALLARYGLKPGDLILVYDDLDLPWRALRIRPKGSPGGHHGVESVTEALGTTEFPRVRLGIAGYHVGDGARYVLSPFPRQQREEVAEFVEYAAEAVACLISEGVEKSMARFNRRAPGERAEDE
ncbi:MAG: aminoacyl-tRNA hydrolase [Bryobacteraceae bacterium]|nr:aminoacyl-tRNA hydrolase [Bryobacteraceae bacterium]